MAPAKTAPVTEENRIGLLTLRVGTIHAFMVKRLAAAGASEGRSTLFLSRAMA